MNSGKMKTTGCYTVKVIGGLNEKSIIRKMEVNHVWNGFHREHKVRNL